MEFQITEAIEIVKALAETENLTHTEALTAFFYEADLSIDDAAELKAYFFESYTLHEMAVDSLSTALTNVFVRGITGESEELSEVDTKETGEGTKYKVRVKDRASNSSYVRYATREKVAELRANPNIASVEMTDHGTTGEDDRGERTAAAKTGRDYDGDGKPESSSKEHAGVVHNAIQRKMGGKPDGQDTRKEEVEVGEAMDFKGARREDERREKIQKEKDKKSPSSKDRRLAMGKFRPGASKEERAEGGRDSMREKGTSPKKDGKKMFEQYLELRENRRAARAAGGYKDDSKKQTDPSKAGFTGISNSIADIMKQNKEIEAKNKKKKVAEGYKGKHGQSDKDHMDSRSDAAKQISGDSETSGAEYSHRSYRGVGKPAKPGERQKHQGKMTDADRNELSIRKNALKKKTQKEDFLPEAGKSDAGVRSRMKISGYEPPTNWDPKANKGEGATVSAKQAEKRRRKALRKEDFLPEADLVDAGRENQGERDKKKLTGKGVDNKSSIKLMPEINETVVTEHESKANKRLFGSSVNETLRSKIQEMSRIDEECCPKCGTPECTCEGKEEKPKKKKAKIDESGMPILEYSRNNATGPTKEMIDPEKDPEGEPGVMNPKGKPKRYKNAGEAPGDRRPNAPGGPELPFDKGTVPNGSGV